MQRLGPYRIIRTIALGGMGEVFLATLERSGGFEKRVALKCVLPRLMADPHFVELFEREARLAAALSHRHIVQIFDFGRDQGRSWLAMEYVHGVDLKAVLDGLDGQGEPMPLGLAVEIGVACARGLDYAHRARDPRGRSLHLVHRDVSPQNVLLSFEGDVKLADFGLAHAAARDPHEGGLQGKFAYMSPEQVEGSPLDGRSDQFALGVVLYEMVSGRRAFFAEDGVEQILDRVRRAAPLMPLEEAAPALPAPLRRVIERTMRAERTERFSDAESLAEALSGAASASGLRPGEPALGPWLRARFPERSRPPRAPIEATADARRPVSAPVETTAAAGQPIAPPTEVTVDASAPVGLRIDPLAATPSGAGLDGDGPARLTTRLEAPPDEAEAPPAVASAVDLPVARPATPSDPPPGSTPWRFALVALILALIGGLAWALSDHTVSIVSPDARLAVNGRRPAMPDATQAADARDAAPDARADPAVPDAAPPDVALAARLPDAAPPDAAPPDAAPPDTRRPTRPITVATRPIRPRVIRPRPDAAPRPPDPPDAAPPPPPAPDARVPPPAAPAGPRVRMFTPAGRIAGPPAEDGWWSVPGGGLLLRVVDGPGPPVVLRIRARGGRFEAAVDARPWGQVWLGERDLGATPAAAVPLDLGRQTLRVIGPDGRETVMRIEAARN